MFDLNLKWNACVACVIAPCGNVVQVHLSTGLHLMTHHNYNQVIWHRCPSLAACRFSLFLLSQAIDVINAVVLSHSPVSPSKQHVCSQDEVGLCKVYHTRSSLTIYNVDFKFQISNTYCGCPVTYFNIIYFFKYK